MTERDLRLLRHVWAALDRLAEEKTTLREAVAEVAEHLDRLEDPDPEWKRRFEGPWEVLRNAGTASTPPGERVVDEATASLRALVAEVLPASERDE